MKATLTTILALSILSALTLPLSGCASSATSSYPTKEVTYIVPWAAGTSADGPARALAETASLHLGKPIVVKNVVGGSGTYGLGELAKAKPDGYTVSQLMDSMVVVQPYLQEVPYKWPDDFEVLSMVFMNPFMWVTSADSPYKNLQDVIADAKKRPGAITYSVTGLGSATHLGMEYFARSAGIKLKVVPFKSATEGVTALLGGHVDTSMAFPPDVASHLEERRLLPLASFSKFPGMERLGLKTLKEQGYDYEAAVSSANVVPKGTPKEVVEKLRAAFKKGMEEKAYVDYMAKVMIAINYQPPEEVVKSFTESYKAMGPFIKELGLAK